MQLLAIEDINQLIIEQSIRAWPVFAGLFVLTLILWKYVLPFAIKVSMENGGGEAIRRILGDELRKQDTRLDGQISTQNVWLEKKINQVAIDHREMLEDAMQQHEEVEKLNIKNVMLAHQNHVDLKFAKAEQTLVDHDRRLVNVESEVSALRKVGK